MGLNKATEDMKACKVICEEQPPRARVTGDALCDLGFAGGREVGRPWRSRRLFQVGMQWLEDRGCLTY